MQSLSVFLLLAFGVSATEGMWIPSLLASIEDEMQAFGLEISAADIYNVNQASLKDAIVHFGGGCTAEVISSQGLLLTNHHCGFSQIQQHSSVEKDYLKNGFWAENHQAELPNPGLTATFIVRMDDVSERVLQAIAGLSGDAKAKALKDIQAAIVSELTANTKYEAFVRPFNYGNSYFVIVTKTYKDVRLVGAPPSAIGKFGGDTDNWMWPRHTGDFSMFRIYADANNEPAEYNEANQPYQAPVHLKINLDGVDEGDFTMVFGFPGRTEQFLTPAATEYVIKEANPMRIHFRSTSLGIIDQAMASSDKVRIQYAAKQSSISNAYKKWIGQNEGLLELNALQKKTELERAFEGLSSVKQKNEYYQVIQELRKLDAEARDYKLARDIFIEYYYYGPEILAFSQGFKELIENYETLEKEGKLSEKLKAVQSEADAFFKDLDHATEQRIFDALTPLYVKYMPDNLLPMHVRQMWLKFGRKQGDLSKRLYAKSIFFNEMKMKELLANPSASKFKKLSKDPAFAFSNAVMNGYFDLVRPEFNRLNGEIEQRMQLYVKGIMEIFPDKDYWFDANSTLRLTYGKAEGSSPKNGMHYDYCTTADGILQKYRSGKEDYALPSDLVALLEARYYSKYAHSDGELHVCFTGSNHTTGGNSGSPALNSRGELVGLNFDRSWESTMSDVLFDAGRCRNIMVDIRYVLWVVDVYARASHLVQEMTLVKGREVPETEPLFYRE
ncbi:MAG: hypothetical protein RL226_368 [Bacteroidota bacterium]